MEKRLMLQNRMFVSAVTRCAGIQDWVFLAIQSARGKQRPEKEKSQFNLKTRPMKVHHKTCSNAWQVACVFFCSLTLGLISLVSTGEQTHAHMSFSVQECSKNNTSSSVRVNSA